MNYLKITHDEVHLVSTLKQLEFINKEYHKSFLINLYLSFFYKKKHIKNLAYNPNIWLPSLRIKKYHF